MLIAVCAVLGLLIGSFLNVVIARVPAGESIVSPPSRCPTCGVPIAAKDNVPVLSWLVLRGRARCCGTPISRRYPLVEIATAVAFGLVAAWVDRSSGSAQWPLVGAHLPQVSVVLALFAFLTAAAAGIALALIDIDTFRLPQPIVAPSRYLVAALLGGSALLAGNWHAALRMVGAGVALWSFYWLLHRVYSKGWASATCGWPACSAATWDGSAGTC